MYSIMSAFLMLYLSPISHPAPHPSLYKKPKAIGSSYPSPSL